MKFKQYLFSRTAHHTYLTVGSNVIYGLLTIWFFILASRVLGPEQFGLLSIILAIYTISFDIFTLGTSQALTRFVSVHLGKKETNLAGHYAQLIFRFRLHESLFLLIGAFLVGKLLAAFYNQPLLTFPMALAFASVGIVLLGDYFISLLRAQESFGKAAFLTAANPIFKIIVLGLVMTFNQANLLTTTLAYVSGVFAVTGLGFFFTPSLKPTSASPPHLKANLFHFAKWMAVWGMAASLASRIDIILLGKLASAYQAGIYAAALKVATGFTLVGGSLSSVLTPKISRLAHQPAQLKLRFSQIFKLVALLSLGMVGVAIVSSWFIPVLFGDSYIEAVPIFYSLTLAAIFFILALPANVTLLALGHSKLIGFASLIQLVIVVAVGLLAIPRLGGQGAALALIISYLLIFIINTGYAVKKIFA